MVLDELDNIKMNFIVGPGRSGTTLLVYVLNQNKACVATPEIKHLIFFYKKYKGVKKVSQALIDEYKLILKKYAKSNKFFVSDSIPTHLDLLKVGDEINYSRLTKLFYLCLTPEKNNISEIKVIVDKNPYYTFYIDTIMSFFPESKFIVMFRDYRAYVLSNRQSQKGHVRILSVCYYALTWNLFYKRTVAAKKKYPTKINIVTYENLVADKENMLKEIAGFFDITYSTYMLDFHESIKEKLKTKDLTNVQYDRAIKKIEGLSKPINPNRVYAWQKELNSVDIQKADFFCSSEGKQLDYIPQSDKISNVKKLSFQLQSIPARIRLGLFLLFNHPKIKLYLDFRT
jgi:hypothetical protein